MSRHDLPPKADQAGIVSVTIGWDRPLQTFFAQVFVRTEDEPDEGEAMVWVGTAPGELPTAATAIAVVSPYAVIPDDLAGRLDAERRATIGVRDGAQQTAAKQRLFGTFD